jgi:DNA ligase-1
MMDQLSEACERIAATPRRNQKIARLKEFLGALDEADRLRAVRFLTGNLVDGVNLSVGHTLLRDAVSEASGWDSDLVRLCLREVGDTGEGISHLLFARTENQRLSLAGAESIYARLAAARRTSLKLSILVETFRRYRPIEIRYFVKAITGGWRIGLQERMVREAVASGGWDSGALAPKVFEPLDFMLAKPYEQVPRFDAGAGWWVEDKYDGIRAQVHVSGGRVRIFTRGMEDATAAFPEVVASAGLVPGEAILDGEVLAWRESPQGGRALAFTVLQQRLARKKVAPSLMERIPVRFIAYDLLFQDGAWLLAEPIEARRARLEALGVMVSPLERLGDSAEIEPRFMAARGRGNEGLILKQSGTPYEPGKRSGLWIKVKRPYGTLDVVVTAAEQGHGRRATVLSDYTFAVREGERFLNVGRAYSGLTDEEIRELTRIFRAATVERFGRVSQVKPEVVIEVAFDGIQRSPRHKSGYALRFPRIVSWRRDKKVEEIDTIEQVKALYEASLEA